MTCASPPLQEDRDYHVHDGRLKGHVFHKQFGHFRQYTSVRDLVGGLEASEIEQVTSEAAEALPRGPMMPSKKLPDLGRLLTTSKSPDEIRAGFCTGLGGRGIEFGPGSRPTMVPSGCHVTYADKYTFEEAKSGSFVAFENDDLFAEVTVKGSMEKAGLFEENSQDFVIACHVIEHVANVITAIENAHRYLKPGGALFLVIPHKEYMFDKNRPLTSIEHFVSDYLADEVPVLEHYLEYSRRARIDQDWLSTGQRMAENGEDNHYHTFTEASLEELFRFLPELGITFSNFTVHLPVKVADLVEFYLVAHK